MVIRQIKEVCLYTDNLEATQVFYSETLGFSIISQVASRHVFFRVGELVLLFFNPEITKKEENLPPHYAIGTPAFSIFKLNGRSTKSGRINYVGKA